MKLACVIHRFGADIAGGSERHCRLIAEHLAARHDVTILTTCARDHVTWKNEYPEGESRLGPLRVVRFAVAHPRRLHRFMDLSESVFRGKASDADEEQWFRENGPETPALLEHLRTHGSEYDRVLFWSFRYYHSYFGVPLVADRAVLVPTAEEDPAIHIRALDRLFATPAGYLFLTPEEQALVGSRAPATTPAAVIGSGVDPAPQGADTSRLASLGITDPFALYLGRIDPNKGCQRLIREFIEYADSGRRVQLVMAGPANMPIPEHPSIRRLGFVDEAVRDALLAAARVLVMPSPFESLSMVVLEAWNHGVPVLVNARCGALRGQVLRADGGLYYRNAGEFAASLDYLIDRPEVARQLGAQGLAYVEREYRWPTVMAKVEVLLAETVTHKMQP
jgi:glycosyltransferase involved in cell wall biosynthesis